MATRKDMTQPTPIKLKPLNKRQIKPMGMSEDTKQLIGQAGTLAAERLHELLASDKFSKLRVSDQVMAMTLAFNRAFGSPISESVQKSLSVNLSSDNSDAIATAMRKLAVVDLPERRSESRDGGQDGSSHDFIDHHSQKSDDSL